MAFNEQAFNEAMQSSGNFGVDGETGSIVSAKEMAEKWKAVIEEAHNNTGGQAQEDSWKP